VILFAWIVGFCAGYWLAIAVALSSDDSE